MKLRQSFAKVRVEDIWCSLRFFVGDKPMRSGKCRVLWPDGSTQEVRVEVCQEDVSYSDMGHRYTVVSHPVYVTFKHNGANVTVRADKAGCLFPFGAKP